MGFAAKAKGLAGKHPQLLVMLCTLFLAGCSAPTSATPPSPTPPSPTPLSTSSPSSRITATPISSTGCGKSSPVAPGTSVEQMISSGGVDREYLLHVPSRYRANSIAPMVLNFHGHGSSARGQETRSGLSTVADQQGFIVVYPQGLPGPGGATGWATTARRTDKVDDVLFVSDVLNQVQARLCIDPHRIFATGFSNGGGMTNVLACTMAERVAAFAPVSGSYPPYPGGCHPSRPVPILEIHGTGDEVVPYDGKPATFELPVLTWLQEWAAQDGCEKEPTIFYEQGNVTGLDWTACKGNATVIHYRITGEGHVWPANIFPEPGGPTDHKISASLLIWLFFQQHPLPGATAE